MRGTEAACGYCGNTFELRREPLGHTLCPLCVNILREQYAHASVAHLAREFHVGPDAIKEWATRLRLRRQLVCVTCGRELLSSSPSGQCPLCIVAHRGNH